MTSQLDVRDVSVAYRGDPVVRDVTLSLQKGTIGCLLGPSGCGKTSLLRAIAGFEPLARGEIRLGGEVVARPGAASPPEARNVGMVFQDFALFPHLSVAGNVGFGLRSWAAADRDRRIAELLDLVGLSDSASAYPHRISGGQQQRVALARAMAPRPRILLMDEPFSSIDTDLREQLATEVRAMLLRDGMTAVLVTHDQNEAFAMADVVGVFGEGRLRQWDTAHALYYDPADRFVADFIGQGALVDGTVADGGRIDTVIGPIPGPAPEPFAVGARVSVLLRPDDIVHDDSGPFSLRVVKKVFRGADYLCALRLPGGGEIRCLVPGHHDHPIGDTIGIRLAVRHLSVFPGG